MSLDSSWAEVLQRESTKHFSAFDLGVPWDLEDSIDGKKISLTFMDPEAIQINREEYELLFKIKLVCTTESDNLYYLSKLSGDAANLLLQNIVTENLCATPVLPKVKINLFDFKHGYKQSLMEQSFTSRVRG